MRKLIIETNVKEKEFMESVLNQTAYGQVMHLHLVFYAMAKSWHVDKLSYYIGLINEVEGE